MTQSSDEPGVSRVDGNRECFWSPTGAFPARMAGVDIEGSVVLSAGPAEELGKSARAEVVVNWATASGRNPLAPLLTGAVAERMPTALFWGSVEGP
ncbi:hypothetical protein PG993_014602 [Apiospora rasikravindrae]|uniref:Uncharacterized protein n=1 Tax=Apiospora rasikravindrae TaxID=990691 RepID=A0ABR1RQ88_9PEZI